MTSPTNELIAKVLRLQTHCQNLIYVLESTELSNEQRAQVQALLLAVQNELLKLTGGISLN